MKKEAICYNIYGGNKRKDRPNGGFYTEETQQTKTLDSTTGLNPTANQGGLLIIYADLPQQLDKDTNATPTQTPTT